MKKLVTLAIGGLLCSVMGANSAQAQEFTLKWGHYIAHGPYLEMEDKFIKEIERRTDGRVKIDVVYAGGLGDGSELITLAGRGAVDIAAAPPGYYPDQLSFWKAFQIPFIFGSSEQAIDVLNKSLETYPVYQEEMDKMGVVWLFQQPLGPYFLTGKTADCGTVEGLKGKKIRSFGGDVPKAISAIGAVPVSVAASDSYESLQRGTVDYAFHPAADVDGFKLYETASVTCGPIMAITGHNIVMGKRSWDKLPDDIQTIIKDQAHISQLEYLEWLSGAQDRSLAHLKEEGVKVVPFPSDQLASWQAAAPDFLADWQAELEGRGQGEMAAKIVKSWREWTAN